MSRCQSRRRVGTGLDEGPHVRSRQAAAGDVVAVARRRSTRHVARWTLHDKDQLMLRLSKKADYALMAMKHLATRTDLASASAREIAEEYDIPVELMAKVLQRLARRGLLTSHQGTRGGYRLARGAERDLRRRHHPGHRWPADGHRVLDRSGELRPVLEVQRARSAVAHQGSHPCGAGDLLAAGSVGRSHRPKSRRCRSRSPKRRR